MSCQALTVCISVTISVFCYYTLHKSTDRSLFIMEHNNNSINNNHHYYNNRASRPSSFAQSFFQAGDIDDASAYLQGLKDEDAAIAIASAAAAAARHDHCTADEALSLLLNTTTMEQQPLHTSSSSLTTTTTRETVMDRRRSRCRRLSRGSGSRRRRRELRRASSVSAAASEAAAATTIHRDDFTTQRGVDQDENGGAVQPMVVAPPDPPQRQDSWYRDALLQGGGVDDLRAILGEAAAAAAASFEAGDISSGIGGGESSVMNDQEAVLEQYRIMAHVEATMRVKQNIGFDMAEYERQRKFNHPEPPKGQLYSQKPKPLLPEPKKFSTSLLLFDTHQTFQPQEPTVPPIMRQSVPRIPRSVPELCPGVAISNSGSSSSSSNSASETTTTIPFFGGEHIVRCLGCQTRLRVNLFATLVQCPDCSTVSPASSAPLVDR
jgi:hypothetical protein